MSYWKVYYASKRVSYHRTLLGCRSTYVRPFIACGYDVAPVASSRFLLLLDGRRNQIDCLLSIRRLGVWVGKSTYTSFALV